MGALRPFLEKILLGEDLPRPEAASALELILREEASATEIGAFLMGLRMKGESVSEIAGFLDAMERHMVPVELRDPEAIDVCGTGGDGASTFNISTTVAFVAAAGGVTVAKHGNRAVSSSSGSADVLNELGVHTQLTPAQAKTCADEAGIGFFFAPVYHPAMKSVGPHRAQLGLRTIFNMLGPLLNPARVKRQLVGVFSRETAQKLAGVLLKRGAKKACTVHSEDGLDEVSVFAPTGIFQVAGESGTVQELRFEYPKPVKGSLKDLAVQTPREAAQMVLGVLEGKPGPAREIVLANAAFAFLVADRVNSTDEGLELAREVIDSGAARAKLDELRELSRELAAQSAPVEK